MRNVFISTCAMWTFTAAILATSQSLRGDEAAGVKVTVGSKLFTESVILGELAVLTGEDAGFDMRHRQGIGGTQIVWNGLLRGEIDIYPDYTGTIAKEILKSDTLSDLTAMRQALAQQGVGMTEPLGFVNPYALGMKKKRAEELGIRKLSDLRDHPDLKFGFSNEFMQRSDGWPSLKQRYSLPHKTGEQVRGLEHALAYRALEQGNLDVTDTYLTDPKIRQYDLRLLEDDLGHFPNYETVYLYRLDLQQRAPAFLEAIGQLEGRISNDDMLAMNSRVEIDRISDKQAAGEFLQFDVEAATLAHRLWQTTLAHLFLVVTSLSAAILVAVPLGVLAAKRPVSEHPILITAEVIQTIPGLALLVLLMPPIDALGMNSIGPAPAIVALFLYSLLPIIRNTHAGITGIPANIRESAAAIGLSPWAQLWQVELPMAARLIYAGIKTTAVINVGYATLGGLIGAGGYGQPIMKGLRLGDQFVMMEGAIPAALMALAVKSLFELSERFVVPKGLRLKPSH